MPSISPPYVALLSASRARAAGFLRSGDVSDSGDSIEASRRTPGLVRGSGVCDPMGLRCAPCRRTGGVPDMRAARPHNPSPLLSRPDLTGVHEKFMYFSNF